MSGRRELPKDLSNPIHWKINPAPVVDLEALDTKLDRIESKLDKLIEMNETEQEKGTD